MTPMQAVPVPTRATGVAVMDEEAEMDDIKIEVCFSPFLAVLVVLHTIAVS
jgi:hypothetical protein